MEAILGRKIGMTQIFDEESGISIPVTVVEAGPCPVVQRKTMDRDGYVAVQLGFEEIKASRANKPRAGHFKAADLEPHRYLREFRVEDSEGVESPVTVSVFTEGQKVDVAGISKGKGFQGAMKRHGFGGGPASHGSSVHRAPMSSGSVDAARVFKGVKKPGQMGNKRVSDLGMTIVKIDAEKNLLLIRGSIPGANGNVVEIKNSVKK